MRVCFQRIHPAAKLPSQNHPTDAGYDVYAALDNPVIIPPGGQVLISSGFNVGIQGNSHQFDGNPLSELGANSESSYMKFVWVLDVRSRSGLAAKNRVFVTNAPGTVDQNYRGELKVILFNAGKTDYIVEPGDRIAQLVVTKAFLPAFVEVENLDETDRGTKGFGSSGN